MHEMRTIMYGILIMGAILLGINGIFNYDVVAAIFGSETVITRVLYALVGISGVVLLATENYKECCSCPETHF